MTSFAKYLDSVRKKMLDEGYYHAPAEGIRPVFEHINNGFSEVFAQRAQRLYSTITILDERNIKNIKLPHHVFIKYCGKYYDATCIGGVKDPLELPMFARSSYVPWYKKLMWWRNE